MKYVLLFFSFLFLSACNTDSEDYSVPANRSKILAEIVSFKSAVLKKDSRKVDSFFEPEAKKKLMAEWGSDGLLNNFNSFFDKLDISSLTVKNMASVSVITAGEPCMQTNSILINNDSVVFEINRGVNKEYKPGLKDNYAEDPNSVCEHRQWWTFIMKKDKLMFVGFDGAD